MNYPEIAAAVYQSCNHFDPYLPPLSADLARAWGKLFAKHALDERDLLAGVEAVYDQHGNGYRPMPADIISAARAIRRERAEREDEQTRQAREDAHDAALAAHNKARLAEITATIGEAHSIPLAPVVPLRRPSTREWKVTVPPPLRPPEPDPNPELGPQCPLCGIKELITDTEIGRGVCDPCWPTINRPSPHDARRAR
jgi:hypothetical protein